ncbi:MAG: MFS transporter [Dehalococcoidia bacterium]|nr:MFS transporter [Dehalococcoidia bacterium]
MEFLAPRRRPHLGARTPTRGRRGRRGRRGGSARRAGRSAARTSRARAAPVARVRGTRGRTRTNPEPARSEANTGVIAQRRMAAGAAIVATPTPDAHPATEASTEAVTEHGRPPAALPLPATLLGRPVFYGWYIVGLAFVAAMMSSGIQAYSLGVFITPMTEELGWSRTDISLGQTISTGMMGVLGLFIGGTLDRRGGRGLMIGGAVLAGLGFILLGQVRELWQYYLVKGGVVTLGMVGMGAMVVNVAVSNWFVRRRGRAIAISAMGISVAALLLPTVASAMITAYGWRAAWAVIGVAVWVVMIPPTWLIMRRRPEDFGLEPDGGRRLAAVGDAREERRSQVDAARWTRRQAIHTPALWMLILTFGLASMGLGAMLLHLFPYLTDTGFSRSEAAAGFSMIGLAGLLSKPFWGLAIERFAARVTAATEFLMMALGIALILAVDSTLSMFLAVFVFGLGIGGVVTVQETVWADYFGRFTLGMVRSIGRPFTIVSSAGGPVLAGVAYDVGGSYEVAFIVFIGTYVAAAVLILLTPEPSPPASPQPSLAAPEPVPATTDARHAAVEAPPAPRSDRLAGD